MWPMGQLQMLTNGPYCYYRAVAEADSGYVKEEHDDEKPLSNEQRLHPLKLVTVLSRWGGRVLLKRTY